VLAHVHYGEPGRRCTVFATWEATINEADGQTAIVRHTLRELLDRLGEVLP
jgi:hypothetical protein